jgi:hypothetical protein
MGATMLTFVACFIVGSRALGSEGDALAAELADEVLARSEKELPPPWEVTVNTPSDRDVGFVTDHPYASAYDLEVAPCSLETEAEQTGGPPSIDIRRVLVAETRNSTLPPPCYRTGCAGGQAVRHLNGMVNPTGPTTVWGWQRSRYFALKAWMDTKNDDDLIAVLASGEVLFAGCNESTIRDKYDLIIRASGGTGTIVIAAEVSPLHDDLAYSYDLRSTTLDAARTAFLSDAEVNVPDDFAGTYAACTDGVCNSPAKYQFVNPGFIMGPVGDIKQMLQDLPQWADTENRLINQYYLRNTDKVVPDYAGILAISLHNMKLDTGIPVEVQDFAGTKSFMNRITNSPVCFVHGTGNSFNKLKEFAAELLA